MSRSFLPIATYRLQFNRHFGFTDARRLVPYLRSLGISHLYASPIFRARRESLHGYDVVDPRELNPELGSREEFDQLTRTLRAHGMGLILDIVPNHMAAHWENPWWWDVLENGRASPWADVFDIDWHAADGKLLLPLLGSPLERVLNKGELQLALSDRGFFVRYFDARFPLDPSSYSHLLDFILNPLLANYNARTGKAEVLAKLVTSCRALPTRFETSPERIERRRRQTRSLTHRLWDRYDKDTDFKAFIDKGLARCQNLDRHAEGMGPLAHLLERQAYQLCHWKQATRRINYRRFFNVTDLVGVRVEIPAVFDQTHTLVRELAAADQIQAVRVDHVDGLYDPWKYLQRLQACLSETRGDDRSFPVWVEKILAEDEALPRPWPVEGTTGYDSLNSLNGVFVEPQGLRALRGIYARFTGDWAPWPNIVYRQKKRILESLFGGELESLSQSLKRLAEQTPGAKALTDLSLKQAIVESIACLPVYRTYIRSFRISKKDRALIEQALGESLRRRPRQNRKAWLFLKRVLLLESHQRAWLDFVGRWQQLTGPAMAKGFEDTALYQYHRLVSLNEVGGDPSGSYASLDDFHERNRRRQRRWPLSLVATSTHDTKRSEDVRARINVLSERPDLWRAASNRWARWNQDKKLSVDGNLVPERQEEVLFYQTLLGAWPMTRGALPPFRRRLCDYLVKAAREAKEFTRWLDRNERHEKALIAFTKAVLDPARSERFLNDFQRFSDKIAFYGALNSLAQVLLKIAEPGIPDFYQGTELWDLSLVDPDNRRAIDFAKRTKALEQLLGRARQHTESDLRSMLTNWRDGNMKLFTIQRALAFRAAALELFLSGEYLPLQGVGARRRNLCAFARHRDGAWVVAVVPRFTSSLVAGPRPPLGEACWKRTHLLLPRRAPDRWKNVLTGETLAISPVGRSYRLPLGEMLRAWPVALLAGPPRS